jgi:hypothetical protein
MLPAGLPAKSQCDVAQSVGQDCNNPDSFPLANALNGPPQGGLRIWHTDYDQVAQFFQVISDEVAGTNGAKTPVCAEVDFGTDGDFLVHYVVITGVDPATKNVWVADPYLGGDPVEFAFEDFLTSYCYSEHKNGAVQVLDTVFNRSGKR